MFKKIAIVLGVLAFALAVSPLYIQRGIIRNFSDVTDYQFFANETVQKGAPQAWKEADSYNQQSPSQAYIDSLVKDKSLAFLVIQDGEILFEQYWRGYGSDSHSGSFSMAKSVVSLLMGIAVDEGVVSSIDDYISKYIPEFDRAGVDTIKIRDILSMSGGFKWTESYINIFGKTANIYYGDQVKKVVGNLKSDYAPGEIFYYSSAETQILGWVLENAYNQSIPSLFSEKIWSKIGAEHDALWSLDKKDGVPKTFCCLNSNARDFARLGQLILQKGVWEDQVIVPENYVMEATSPASWLKDKKDKQVDYYGYQFWIMDHKGLNIPYFRGVKGQFIYVIPEKNAVVVRLGEYVSQDRIHNHSVNSYMHIDAALEILR